MTTRRLSLLYGIVVAAAVATLSTVVAVAHPNDSPTITIQNQSSETVLARLQGATSGYLTIPSGGSQTAYVRGGDYFAFFRYSDGARYHYTKVGPFGVIETAYQVSQVTIILHTITGNANEQPSNANEFGGQ
jgi:hypothetical protein